MLTAAPGSDLGYRQFLISDCTAPFNERDENDCERFLGLYVAQLVCAARVLAAPGSA
jgi:hypothetical protein